MPLLFSYGTLQLDSVQLDSFGRLLQGDKDQLPYYKLEQLEITDTQVLASSRQQFHPIAVKGNPEDFVEGMVFEITAQELAQADQYEVKDYIRIRAKLSSGKNAFVYVQRKDQEG